MPARNPSVPTQPAAYGFTNPSFRVQNLCDDGVDLRRGHSRSSHDHGIRSCGDAPRDISPRASRDIWSCRRGTARRGTARSLGTLHRRDARPRAFFATLLCTSYCLRSTHFGHRDTDGQRQVCKNNGRPARQFNSPFSFAGVPTISIPCGMNDEGLPISMQFVGHLNVSIA